MLTDVMGTVYNSPLSLLPYSDDPVLVNYVNNLIPYSTGFEVECSQTSDFNINIFKSIPFIMDVRCDMYENRFRIPNGLRGIICLYFISQEMKMQLHLNEGSGIHYHVDFVDSFHLVNDGLIEKNKKWILHELDQWKYKGTYNKRDVTRSRTWVRVCSSKQTFEYRIGEMTFDYSLLLTRIMHVNNISNRVKDKLEFEPDIKFEPIEFEPIIDFLNIQRDVDEVESVEKEGFDFKYTEEFIDMLNEMNKVVKNRTKTNILDYV